MAGSMEAAAGRKPGTKRLCIVAAVAAYVLLGIPVWWHTTSIPRPPLPHRHMQQADASFTNTSVLLPVAVHVYVSQPDYPVDGASLAHTVHQQLLQYQPETGPNVSQVTVVLEQHGSCQHSHMTATHSTQQQHSEPAPITWSLPCLHITNQLAGIRRDMFSDAVGYHHAVDDILHQALAHHNADIPGQYVLFVLPDTGSTTEISASASTVETPGSSSTTETSMVVGQYRHAWIWSDAGSNVSGRKHGSRMEHSLAHLGVPVLTRMLFPQQGKEAVAAAKKLPTSASSQSLLLFTLANEPDTAPADGKKVDTGGCTEVGHFNWRFGDFQEAYIQPLADALSMLLRFNVQSQVRLHTSSRVTPKWSKQQQAYLLRPKQLPYFVNSDWNLEFGLDASVGSTGSTFAGTSYESSMAGSTMAGQGSSGSCDAGTGNQGSCPWPSAASGSTAAACSMDDAEQQYTPAHVLHMVLYIPPASQRPLRVFLPGNTLAGTNSFWMPSWGIVHIQADMPACDARKDTSEAAGRTGSEADAGKQKDSEAKTDGSSGASQADTGSEGGGQRESTAGSSNMTSTRSDIAVVQVLNDADMHAFAESVIAGVRVLLGLPAGPQLPNMTARSGKSEDGSNSGMGLISGDDVALQAQVLAADAGIAAWELDMLVRARTAADISEAARVLGSFSRLAQKLPNLAMPDLIGDHVATALASLKEAATATGVGDYHRAREAARAAHGAAEAAFSHPAILAQLSFPESHKIGVYVPFFFPALLPVVAALISEVKRYISRRRSYLRSLAEGKAVIPGVSLEEEDRRIMLQALQERDAAKAATT